GRWAGLHGRCHASRTRPRQPPRPARREVWRRREPRGRAPRRRHPGDGRPAARPPRVSARAPLRAFLIDDEPLALKRLARMLEATGRVEIVGRATDPQRGLKQMASADADVVFLDIHMPGLSGFEVVERLPAGPRVVFTTAYDQHAVQAFETNAIDYLLKPIEPGRLDRSLDRVARQREEGGDGGLRDALAQLAKHLRGSVF